MTHSNHRQGSRESLEKDYVVIALVSKAVPEQKKDSHLKFKKVLDVLAKHNPTTLMTSEYDKTTGKAVRRRYIKGGKENLAYPFGVSDPYIMAAVFTSKDELEKVMMDLKEADAGCSIVISGIFDNTFDICKKIGVGPHTVNMPLGIWGKTELLPNKSILEISTMCGHGNVSPHLINKTLEDVKKEKMTAEDAGILLATRCPCGIFNPERASNLIKALT